MQALTANDVVGLFAALEKTFSDQREFLIALDGKVGDSDLGITMSKSFAAAHATVAAATDGSVGKLFSKAGLSIAKAAPSTMGTLTATGFMRGGKAVEAAETLIDADDNFDAQTKRIGALLLAWTKHPTSAVVTAQKREAGGRVRYVLVKDLGRWPPPTKPGQIHPSQLPNASAVPARYRKAAAAVASDSEGCLDQ